MAQLTRDEFKSICQWFHEAGENKIDFETAWEMCKQLSKEASKKLN